MILWRYGTIFSHRNLNEICHERRRGVARTRRYTSARRPRVTVLWPVQVASTRDLSDKGRKQDGPRPVRRLEAISLFLGFSRSGSPPFLLLRTRALGGLGRPGLFYPMKWVCAVFTAGKLAMNSAHVTTPYTSNTWAPGWLACEVGTHGGNDSRLSNKPHKAPSCAKVMVVLQAHQ